MRLTLSTPDVPNCCYLKCSAQYWSFGRSGAQSWAPERRMSKIKNGGLDQYGKVQSLNGIGGERVKMLCRRSASVRLRSTHWSSPVFQTSHDALRLWRKISKSMPSILRRPGNSPWKAASSRCRARRFACRRFCSSSWKYRNVNSGGWVLALPVLLTPDSMVESRTMVKICRKSVGIVQSPKTGLGQIFTPSNREQLQQPVQTIGELYHMKVSNFLTALYVSKSADSDAFYTVSQKRSHL